MRRWRLTTTRPSFRRARKPRDKAKVEVAVQVATRWIIAKLRPSRQAGRGSYPIILEPAAHDGARAHAVEPPALCRLDAGADHGEIGRNTATLVARAEASLKPEHLPSQHERTLRGWANYFEVGTVSKAYR